MRRETFKRNKSSIVYPFIEFPLFNRSTNSSAIKTCWISLHCCLVLNSFTLVDFVVDLTWRSLVWCLTARQHRIGPFVPNCAFPCSLLIYCNQLSSIIFHHSVTKCIIKNSPGSTATTPRPDHDVRTSDCPQLSASNKASKIHAPLVYKMN